MKSFILIISIITLFSVLSYSQDTKEKNNQTMNDNKDYASNLKPGYEGSVITGYGFRFHKGYYNYDQISIDMINGYRIIPQFYIGAGVGTRIGYHFGDFLMPFYLHLKGNINCNKVSPYFSYDFGIIREIGDYGINFYSKPSVGLYFGRKISFIMAVGSEL